MGDIVAGTGIPAGTTIASISTTNDTITLSADATASRPDDPCRRRPEHVADPDVLMAATYGQGEFAINLAPLILGNAVTVSGDEHAGPAPARCRS